MAYIYDLTDTWNAGGTTFYGIKMNVTNTASASSSKLLSLQVGGSEKFGVDKDGNVGVGTSAPSYKLDVSATGNISGQFKTSGSINALYLADSGTTAGSLYVGTVGNDFRVVTGSNEQVRITSAGNVGIGTTAPTFRLIAANSASDGGWLYSSGTVSVLGLGGYSAAGDGAFSLRYDRSTGGITFNGGNRDAPTERMRIDSSGNVGIGTSAPGTRLDVWTPNGTATTVRWAQTGVTNYDWRIPASTDAFTLNYGGSTERMRIDSSGRLMVGITGALNNNMISAYGTNQNGFVAQVTNNIYSNFQGFNASTVLTFGVDGPGNGYFAGNVGIGTSSPGYKLTVNGGDILVSRGSGAAAADAAINFGGNANNYIYSGNSSNIMAFATNGSERARIDSSGNLLVGTTTILNGSKVTIDSGTTWGLGLKAADNGGTYYFAQFYAGASGVGSINSNGTGTSYNTSSDARLKENIAPADDAAALIDAIQVRKFDWKADGSHQRYGFVAQELIEVAPEAVNVPADEDAMMGVDYSKLVPMLVKEIQSLRARVAQLEGN